MSWFKSFFLYLANFTSYAQILEFIRQYFIYIVYHISYFRLHINKKSNVCSFFVKKLSVHICEGNRKIRTTGLAGGLFKPYKGLLPALESKDSLKRFASRNIIYSPSPKGLYLFVTFYRLTRKRVYILLQRHLIIFKIFL